MSRIISLIIAAVIAIVLLVPLAGMDFNTHPDATLAYYDDYLPNDSATSASGSLELVTVGDHQYIHAKALGDGEYSVSGYTHKVSIQKAPLDVFVALGQSNNAYAFYERALADPLPDLGTAYYYGSTSAPATGVDDVPSPAMYSLVNPSTGDIRIADKAPAFCKTYYDISGHKVYYINGSWPGSIIEDWQPGSKCFTKAASIIDSAMDQIDTDLFDVTVRGYTWIQGENNKNMPEAQYIQYFTTMNNSILSGGMGIDLDHCFISKVRENYPGPSAAQIALAASDDSITLSTSAADSFTVDNHKLVADGVHYSQLGDNIIGVDLGRSAGTYYFPDYVEPDEQDYSRLIQIIPIVVILAIIIAIVGVMTKNGR